jgi:hypothetical protein
MSRDVSIDSNLLLLLIVGSTSRAYITKHQRLKAYTAEDFDKLASVIGCYDKIVLLPHTLTETSNLLRQNSNRQKSAPAYRRLARAIFAEPHGGGPAGIHAIGPDGRCLAGTFIRRGRSR